ncbi:MFS transporter [Streptomyces sp. MNU89]|uniref:MFS transporter n=1 Tax=Streptomyces sp. MNU89 TaxID=2560025 RepID=UPI001E46E3A5|nr:MFS transporter [Streptomyces sp. MNU89]MCC9742677.1 MFS transporter [Streptomyces sp. MNU89]
MDQGSAAIAARMNRLPLTPTLRRVIVTVGLALFFDMFEIFMSGVLGAVLAEEYQLGRTEVSAVMASVFVGMFIGVLAMGRLAHRLGRRRALLLAVAVYTVFSALGAVGDEVWMVVGARFLAGLGIGPVLPLADAYLGDLLPSRSRGRYTAWAYTIAFTGVPAVGLLARWLEPMDPLGLAGWRWLFLTGAAGGLSVLLLRHRLVESPRWLASVGRTAEAEAVLARLEAESGDRAGPSAAARPAGTEVAPDRRPAAVVRTRLSPVHRRRVAMLAVFHLLQAFGGYGFGTMAPLVLADKGYSIVNSLLFSAVTFVGYPLGSLLSVPLMERVERKHLIVATSLAMAGSGLLFGFARGEPMIIISGLCFTAVTNVFSNAYHVYQAEIFPTAARVSAVSWTYSLSRLTTAAMPFIMVPFLAAHGPGALFAGVALTLIAIAVNIGVLGPTTNGLALEEMNEALARPPAGTRLKVPGAPGDGKGDGKRVRDPR